MAFGRQTREISKLKALPSPEKPWFFSLPRPVPPRPASVQSAWSVSQCLPIRCASRPLGYVKAHQVWQGSTKKLAKYMEKPLFPVPPHPASVQSAWSASQCLPIRCASRPLGYVKAHQVWQTNARDIQFESFGFPRKPWGFFAPAPRSAPLRVSAVGVKCE